MEHKRLNEKLDSISHNELGISFDEGLIWEKLEKRLVPRVHTFNRKWLIAATLFFSVLFFPFSLLEKESMQTATLLSEKKDVDLALEKTIETLSSSSHIVLQHERTIPNIQPKRVTIELAPVHQLSLVADEKIEVGIKREIVFALEDISVIQSSLEESKKKQEKSVNIKTQWQKSFARSNEEYQALKVKLKETPN